MKNKIKNRIDISNIDDFKRELYRSTPNKDKSFIEEVVNIFSLEEIEVIKLNEIINNTTTYRSSNIYEFIDYIKKIVEVENLHNKLIDKLAYISELYIEREEYDRKDLEKEDLSTLLQDIQLMKIDIVKEISVEETQRIEEIEEALREEHLYSKDIELLRKILIKNGDKIYEEYSNNIRVIAIKIPNKIKNNYIGLKEGSLEYYYHLKTNVSRLNRIIKNIDKYIFYDNNKQHFKINQSEIMQESKNIAIVNFQNEEFKAVSGKVNIDTYCNVVLERDAKFESKKVNKLGQFGQGYDRANDSEKKILEYINKEIENGKIKGQGELILYTKLEPCNSCYYVIKQFIKIHKHIDFTVKFIKKYG